jgi:hypothetical protein
MPRHRAASWHQAILNRLAQGDIAIPRGADIAHRRAAALQHTMGMHHAADRRVGEELLQTPAGIVRSCRGEQVHMAIDHPRHDKLACRIDHVDVTAGRRNGRRLADRRNPILFDADDAIVLTSPWIASKTAPPTICTRAIAISLPMSPTLLLSPARYFAVSLPHCCIASASIALHVGSSSDLVSPALQHLLRIGYPLI